MDLIRNAQEYNQIKRLIELDVIDILIGLVGLISLIAVLFWIYYYIQNMILCYKPFDLVKSETYDLDSLKKLYEQEHALSYTDIQIFSSTRPLMIFIGGNMFYKQIYQNHTLLVSTALFQEPFDNEDRLATGAFLLYYFHRLKHIQSKKTGRFTYFQFIHVRSLILALLSLAILFFFLPTYSVPDILFLWTIFCFFLITFSRYRNRQLAYKADQYASSLVEDYPTILENIQKKLSMELSKKEKVKNVFSNLFGPVLPASAKERVRKLALSKKSVHCPNCDTLVPQGFSWCNRCNFTFSRFSYSSLAFWTILVLIIGGWMVGILMEIVEATLLPDNGDFILLSIALGIGVSLMMGYLTGKFQFKEMLVKKPNLVRLTGLYGIFLLLSTIISITPAIQLGYGSSDLLVIFLFSPFLGYIFSGFIFYYFVVSTLFKKSEKRWGFPRCQSCESIISQEDEECPYCWTKLKRFFLKSL